MDSKQELQVQQKRQVEDNDFNPGIPAEHQHLRD